MREYYEDIKEARTIIDAFFDVILENTNKLSSDALLRISISLNILRMDDYPDLI